MALLQNRKSKGRLNGGLLRFAKPAGRKTEGLNNKKAARLPPGGGAKSRKWMGQHSGAHA
jgi:hypothetical protein